MRSLITMWQFAESIQTASITRGNKMSSSDWTDYLLCDIKRELELRRFKPLYGSSLISHDYRKANSDSVSLERSSFLLLRTNLLFVQIAPHSSPQL